MTLAQELILLAAVPIMAFVGIIGCIIALIMINRKEKRNEKR